MVVLLAGQLSTAVWGRGPRPLAALLPGWDTNKAASFFVLAASSAGPVSLCVTSIVVRSRTRAPRTDRTRDTQQHPTFNLSVVSRGIKNNHNKEKVLLTPKYLGDAAKARTHHWTSTSTGKCSINNIGVRLTLWKTYNYRDDRTESNEHRPFKREKSKTK